MVGPRGVLYPLQLLHRFPVLNAQLPSTQPSSLTNLTSNITTRPSIDTDSDSWTVEIIRGGSESEAKFAMPKDGNQFSDTTDTGR